MERKVTEFGTGVHVILSKLEFEIGDIVEVKKVKQNESD